MYNLILADGTTLENLTKNGDCFVSKTEVDESIFENNLSTLTIQNTEEDTEEVMTNAEFVQQLHYENFHGNTGYYLAFRELTEAEVKEATLTGLIEYVAMMADIELEV